MAQEMAGAGHDFERPIVELEQRIAELESFTRKTGVDMSEDLGKLRERCNREKREIFANLTSWQRIQVSRNPGRPDCMDYIAMIFENFVELHGDRAYADDNAIITGLCSVGGEKIMLIAHRRGRSTKERLQCNFGSAHPEGYRKALEKMKLAEKFHLPVVTLVNTPGAYPGIGAEERGQASIIAKNVLEMSRLKTPIISIVIGEGGSGGALGICVADRLCILEFAYLSVISPEGCSAILWRDNSKAPLAAEMLRLTPKELTRLGIIDETIPEPLGGAHRNHREMGESMKSAILRMLKELKSAPLETVLEKRYEKYRNIGIFLDEEQQRLSTETPPAPAIAAAADKSTT